MNVSIFLALLLSCRLIRESSADKRSLSGHFLLSASSTDLSSSAGQSPRLALYCLSFPEEWNWEKNYYFSQSRHIWVFVNQKIHSELFLKYSYCSRTWCPGNQCVQNNLFLFHVGLLSFPFSSYLYWGQTWASGWIFRNATVRPRGHRWWTHGPARSHTFHTGPADTNKRHSVELEWRVIAVF